MECSFEEKGDVLTVGLEGRFVSACSEDVREQVTRHTERFVKIVFDLSKMTHIDSSGLGVLVQFLKRAQSRGGQVKIACIQPHPRMVFDITKVYRVFEIYETVEQAVASYGE